MVWDFGALGPAKEVFERVDHRHLDDLLPGLPAPCEDTAQLLADYLGDQLARTDLPFAHLVGDVAVVDAWPDADSRAWGAEAFIRHELHQRSLNEVLGPNPTAEQLARPWGRTSSASSRSRE